MLQSTIHDPMFWAIAVCVCTLLFIRTRKREHGYHRTWFSLMWVLAIIVNLIMVFYTL